MSERKPSGREAFRAAVEALRPGGCVEVSSAAEAAGSARELIEALLEIEARGGDFVSRADGIDTRGGRGDGLFALCRALEALSGAERREKQREGIERAREQGKYRGRKPIAVDEGLFESVVGLWRSGQISARQAMARLDLKPNTFYRRIKEREERTLRDCRKAGQEIKSELKKQVRELKKRGGGQDGAP